MYRSLAVINFSLWVSEPEARDGIGRANQAIARRQGLAGPG
ncbi:MAG: hypothetical protein U0401_31150 [Anaerolineae bacterium]